MLWLDVEFQSFANNIKKIDWDKRSKSERILPRSNKQRGVSVYIQKKLYSAIWEKNRKHCSLYGVEEMERSLKYVKN